ncbi:MAG: 16S rRNA (guanine(527)-N(7))-methyltransferase RsmG [Armatimonadetes bacterium]|nr:16S rRNA (guanine(527)-N(7))-methyltransferase RsmG [Armatimonadota bacterium]
MNRKALSEEASAFCLDLSDSQLASFELFEERLYEANEVMNLTRVPKAECWSRHFLDSLILSPLIPDGAKLLDIGSGPGMPGACLAIARPDLTVSIIESAGKALNFLRDVFGKQELLSLIQGRAEDVAHIGDFREKFDVVTGRAVAPLSVQIEISAPFVILGGMFIPMRTDKDKELPAECAARLGLSLLETRTYIIRPLLATRHLPVYQKHKSTPATFPRTWAKIRQAPSE